MSEIIMIREPAVEHRGRGIRRWSVAWGLFDHRTQRSWTRRKVFFTERGVTRWIESKRIRPEDRWQPRDTPDPHAAATGGGA